jgi:hypothetical protein
VADVLPLSAGEFPSVGTKSLSVADKFLKVADSFLKVADASPSVDKAFRR